MLSPWVWVIIISLLVLVAGGIFYLVRGILAGIWLATGEKKSSRQRLKLRAEEIEEDDTENK